MTRTLGTMRRVNPRDIWPDEEADFTPWMADEEGVSLLGDTLGMRLICTGVEVPAGQYRADIVCYDDSDVGHQQTVVIENQLRRSDHEHLGKLLTYGAVLGADVCVWIATQFTQEHRHAVDALNYPEDRLVDYYCVKLTVSQIDDSAPAPRFDPLVGPERWSPWEAGTAPAGMDDLNRERFWALLDERLARKGLSETIPGKNLSYRRYDIGFRGVSISLDRDSESTKVGLRIYRTRRGVDTESWLYSRLQKDRSAIDHELGEPVQWQRPSLHRSAIELTTPSHIHDESMWEREVGWMISRIEIIRQVLLPRLEATTSR